MTENRSEICFVFLFFLILQTTNIKNNMKQSFFTVFAIVWIFFITSAFVTSQVDYLNLQVTDINPTNPDIPHKGLVEIPSISLDNHTLYFDTPCDGCTLNIVDSNNVVVYTIVIPTGTTSLVLPATLFGEYELQIICGNYLFYGKIDLP